MLNELNYREYFSLGRNAPFIRLFCEFIASDGATSDEWKK